MKGITILIIVVVALFIIADGFYVVDETEQVIITQFGKPIGKNIQ